MQNKSGNEANKMNPFIFEQSLFNFEYSLNKSKSITIIPSNAKSYLFSFRIFWTKVVAVLCAPRWKTNSVSLKMKSNNSLFALHSFNRELLFRSIF